MLNHSSEGNSPLGTCRFTLPWFVDASTRNAYHPRRPAQKYACLINSSANQFLRQLAAPKRPAFVHLVRVLAGERSTADRHAWLVVVDNELSPSLKVVVSPERASDLRHYRRSGGKLS
jgi:hypothetical protein